MAIVNDNRLEISKLDFDGIKASLKTFLQSQTEFTDYDFDGSGMSVLLDVLSYNTHYMSYYLNMVGNEMFLDSATNRYSVISLAKQMGYMPSSRTAATSLISFTAAVSGGATTVTVPAWTRFSVVSDRIKYIFQPVSDTIATVSGGSATFSNLSVKEGVYVSNSWTYGTSGKIQQFIIPNKNIDTSTLTVSVKQSKSNSSTDSYSLYTELEKLDNTSKAYFIQEIEDGLYEIYFGDGVYGKKPSNENIIVAEYLVTSGSEANYAGRDILQKFTIEDSLIANTGTATVSGDITASSYASGGTETETIESIKHNAPRNYSAQERLVTESDYKNIVLTKYSNAKAVKVWSGDPSKVLFSTGKPQESGVVYIAIVPVVATQGGGLDPAAKDYVTKVLLDPYRILGIRNEIVDPNTTRIKVRGKVFYNPRLGTGKSEDTLKNGIIDAIETYASTNLETFDVSFRYSKLMKAIDDSDKSILSNETKIQYSAQTHIIGSSNVNMYERSSLTRKGVGSSEFRYAKLKPFSFDTDLKKGSIYSDWFWIHVQAMNPDKSGGWAESGSMISRSSETEFSWQKDIVTYRWREPELQAASAEEHVSLVKVRFIDDLKKASVYESKYSALASVMQDRRGKGQVYLQTEGGHIVPFQDYRRPNLNQLTYDINDVYEDDLIMTASGDTRMGYHFALVDYKTGIVSDVKQIPIFAFDSDVTVTLFTTESETGINMESVTGTMALKSTTTTDRDLLYIHTDSELQDIVPKSSTVIMLDTSTLSSDLEMVPDTKSIT